jgi:threonine aldolase
VAKARRARKLFGGGMRQAGVIAAAALYALENHLERLAEDHANAKVVAQAIADTPGLRLDPPDAETNLIWFEVDPELGTSKDVAASLKQRGVLIHTPGPQTMRACTHLDVSAAQAERAAETIRHTLRRLAPVT